MAAMTAKELDVFERKVNAIYEALDNRNWKVRVKMHALTRPRLQLML